MQRRREGGGEAGIAWPEVVQGDQGHKRKFGGTSGSSANDAETHAPANIAGPLPPTLSKLFHSYPNVMYGVAEDNGVCKRVERQTVTEIHSHWDVDTWVRLFDESISSHRGYQKTINIMTCEWDEV